MSRINALKAIRNTSHENKALRVRELRALRDHRLHAALPDLTPGEWPENPRERVVYSNMELSDEAGHRQWMHNVHKGELVKRAVLYGYQNVGFTGKFPQTKWGVRGYNIPEFISKDCDFTEITQEHGLYMSNYAGTSVLGSTFMRCGSQGVQFAHRPNPYQQYDADCLPYSGTPKHRIEDSHFIDCGYRGTRPSYNATYFDPGSSAHPADVLFKDSSWVSHWDSAGPKGNWSTGAFVMVPSQGGPINDEREPIGAVRIENCLFDFTGGDRSIGKITGATSVHLTDSCFIARAHNQGHININKGSEDGWETDIYVTNCVSRGVELRLWDGSDIIARVDLDCPGGGIYISSTGLVRTRGV